ncbi:Cytochrome P450 [Rhypophila decipiens]
MEQWDQASYTWIAVVASILLGSAFTAWSAIPKRQTYADAPIACVDDPKHPSKGVLQKARERFRTDAIGMLQEGYRKYKGQPWYVPSPLGERLMIPSKYVEELKNAPVDEVDFVATFFEMFEGRYTTMGSRSTLHPRVAKHELNQNMAMILDPVMEEIKDAFDVHLPATDADWTPLHVHDAVVNIVARVSSRMFGGTDLSTNKEWVDATINFALDGFIGAQAIKKYPHFVRPLAAKFIPALTKIKEHHATAQRVIVPILREREKAAKSGWSSSVTGKAPADFLQWMVEAAVGEEMEKSFIAQIQLKLSFAAIHTSAAAPAQLLYDLCCLPQYIQELRAEISEARDSSSTGDLDKRALLKLEKLDSLMKETQRFNPLLLITFERIITKTYTLSDGFRIPANTQIGVPTQAISMDPEIYPNPEKFDPLRFYKIKQAMEAEGKLKNNAAAAGRLAFASSNHESMAFGYGRHACPGRWFAGNEIKMIMVYLLENYDFRLPGAKTGLENRPPSLCYETQYLPNPEAVIEFRRRKGN